MGANTRIGWCDNSWNPWQGCLKISPGCKFCYMYRDKRRYGHDPAVVVRSKTTFEAPRRWRDPRVIFTCSWSDFFIEAADAWRPEAWEVMRRTPQHTYLVLTKRPERIVDHLPSGWPWAHVWLGVSVETREYLGRADALRTIRAARRFLCCEPLLADLGPLELDGIHWVITGGESGPQQRPMEMAWMASLRDQCVAAGVSLYVKQDAAPRDSQQGRIPADLWAYKDRPGAALAQSERFDR
jgi:protein gp37